MFKSDIVFHLERSEPIYGDHSFLMHNHNQMTGVIVRDCSCRAWVKSENI